MIQRPASSIWEERRTVKQDRGRKVVIAAGSDATVAMNRMTRRLERAQRLWKGA